VLTDPFLAYLQRILGPEYNYFEFGQRYVGSLINFRASVLGHRERWDKVSGWQQVGWVAGDRRGVVGR
jgi:hypothetical protein